MTETIKQMVVVNMAVPMGISQLTAQIAHASMLAVLKEGSWDASKFSINCYPELQYWLQESFTLVVCKTWGKESILKLRSEAEELGLLNAVMEDYGMTTAIAIGPAKESELLSFKRLTLL